MRNLPWLIFAATAVILAIGFWASYRPPNRGTCEQWKRKRVECMDELAARADWYETKFEPSELSRQCDDVPSRAEQLRPAVETETCVDFAHETLRVAAEGWELSPQPDVCASWARIARGRCAKEFLAVSPPQRGFHVLRMEEACALGWGGRGDMARAVLNGGDCSRFAWDSPPDPAPDYFVHPGIPPEVLETPVRPGKRYPATHLVRLDANKRVVFDDHPQLSPMSHRAQLTGTRSFWLGDTGGSNGREPRMVVILPPDATALDAVALLPRLARGWLGDGQGPAVEVRISKTPREQADLEVDELRAMATLVLQRGGGLVWLDQPGVRFGHPHQDAVALDPQGSHKRFDRALSPAS